MKFTELTLNKPIQDAIKKAGYMDASPIQEQAIPAMMEGRDMIACAQTGTGKTAAFALPILEKLSSEEKPEFTVIRALILTPTRELAIQNFDNFKKYGRYLKLRCGCIYGGAKENPQIVSVKQGCDILVATPGRLIDFMDRGIVNLSNVEVFVLDEADRMLDMGFIHDIYKIVPKMTRAHQSVMFSATMPKEIEQLARELLQDPVSIKVAPTTTAAETVDQKLIFTAKENKKLILARYLTDPEVIKSIVFTRTKHGADHLVRDLKKLGIAAVVIHGDRTQGQRQNALEQFRAGKASVLVATDVAARGIDIPSISHVFNYELPNEPESYIHRIGRAGRAGESGIAITLCCADELGLLHDIEKMMKLEIPTIEDEYSIELQRSNKGGRAVSGKGRNGRTSQGRGGRTAQGKSTRGRSVEGGRRNPVGRGTSGRTDRGAEERVAGGRGQRGSEARRNRATADGSNLSTTAAERTGTDSRRSDRRNSSRTGEYTGRRSERGETRSDRGSRAAGRSGRSNDRRSSGRNSGRFSRMNERPDNDAIHTRSVAEAFSYWDRE